MTRNLIKKSNRAKAPVKAAMNVPTLETVWVVEDDNRDLHVFNTRNAARDSRLGAVRKFIRG